MRLFLICLLFLAACTRPLTTAETAFVKALQGEEIDTTRVRINNGHFAGSVTYSIPVRPRTTCQERLWPPITQSKTVKVAPVATVIHNKILLRKDVYRDDLMTGWPKHIDLYRAMLLAHEATHVWQWQNRKLTGYTPLKALTEHVGSKDPYLFDTDTPRDFLSFGYEQQGSIVEEYVCCRLLDPKAPRTERLRAMISEYMPIEGLDAALGEGLVRLPWAGAETEGICR